MRARCPLRLRAGRLSAVLVLAACSPDPGSDGDARYVETGDLDAIERRGRLRVLVPPDAGVKTLPRTGLPLRTDRDLARAFARESGLEISFVPVPYEDLIPGLVEGRGDVIASNLTATRERRERIDFTTPLALVREQVVTRADDTAVEGPEDLVGRQVAVHRSATFWDTVEALRDEHPGIALEPAPEDLDAPGVLEAVAAGRFDVTVADSNLAAAVLAYEPRLRVAFDLSGDRIIAWGVRRGADRLRRALDAFLAHASPATRRRETHTLDLTGIRQRRLLRVLTLNTAATYFVWRGERHGFEYDLARRFADRHDLRLAMVVPPAPGRLLPWLTEGRGDVVAAGLTPTERRRAQGVAFSRPYNEVRETVVTRAGEDEALRGPRDLAGRTLVVRRKSAYWRTLSRLRERGIDFELRAAPESQTTAELIGRVAAGEIDLTLADSQILELELSWRDDVRGAFAVGEPVEHAWAVRADNPELLAAVDAYFEDEVRGLHYNLTYRRYFESPQRSRRLAENRAKRSGRLSPYDELVRRYAERYGFDWRLIVAQMYQESRFDPDARSFAGALGLLQVTPRAAREVGFEDPSKPEVSIHAGVRYLQRMRARFAPELGRRTRTWFALASYNAGHGHVRDARRLARRKGWDPDRWFEHVERAMLLLARPEYARRARFGYVRGEEPVRYVREIRERYAAYLGVARRGSTGRPPGVARRWPAPSPARPLAPLVAR